MAFLDRCFKAVRAVQSVLAEQQSSQPQVNQTQKTRASGYPQTNFTQLLSLRFPEYELRQNIAPIQLIPGFSSGSACSVCGTPSAGRFCSQCGGAVIQSDVWYCSCGSRNEQLYCTDCGRKRPPRAAKTGYINISYALYQNGQPKLAILLIPSNEWNSSAVVSTMAACKSAGIPCQRYFKEFRNREDYVVDRVRQALR